MKTTILIFALTIFSLCAAAQELAMNISEKKQPSQLEKAGERSSEAEFVFTNYGVDLEHKDLVDYPEHLLGDQVARKMFAVRKLYVRRQSSSIGYTNNTVEIAKPVIYNAVLKLESYFKKSVRKDEMDATEAAARFAAFLDIASVVYYEDDTTALENAVKQAKEPGALTALFDKVQIR